MKYEESDRDSSSPEDLDDVSDADFKLQLRISKRKLDMAVETASPKRLRQRTASQSASSSGTSRPDTPTTPLATETRRGGRSQRREWGRSQSAAGHLYESVRSGRSAIVMVVDDWLDDYKQDREEGLRELFNFVVQCCGCKGLMTREMFTSMQNADIISHLTKEFNEDSVSYPVVAGGSLGRRFREGLCEFVSQLVRRCQNSLLYDEFLFSSLVAFLTGLADSQVRAFRHTSTLLAMRLMSAVVKVAAVVYAQVQVTHRRFQLEKTKSSHQQATERLEELQNSYNELLEHQEELDSLMNAIFKGVFVHRYRDKVPEIRALCVAEMREWLRENPGAFLNDGYLKYLGWMLHDKQPGVRVQAVLSLQKLYEEQDFIGRLELFTSRFKERLLNMVLDRDSDVAEETVRLLLLIRQNMDDGLSEEECSRVYPLVFSAHRGLASVTGEFLYYVHSVCVCVFRLSAEVNRLSEGKKENRSVTFLNLLTSFFIQSKYHEHAAYLVDSLWSVAGAELRDWETMTSLLLQARGERRGLDDDEEAALIEIMISAVRQAAEATPPASRLTVKKSVSNKSRKIQNQERKRITHHFIPLLPPLLAKYSADVEKVRCLLTAPLHFDLEAYGSTGRLEKCLDLLLSEVCEVVKKHNEQRVLEACVRVLYVLCSERYTFCTRAEKAVSQLLDATIERFTAHFSDILQGSADEDDVYSAATSLKRLAIFSSSRDLTERNLFQPCFILLKTGVETREIHTELMLSALRCAMFQLLWEKMKISDNTVQTARAGLRKLEKMVGSFCAVCQSCLPLDQSDVRDQAFECLCDVLVMFGGAEPQSVSFSADETLRADMASFLLDYIFTEDDDDDDEGEDEEEMMKLGALRRRRNQLAGYCKLILYGVFDLRAATDVLKYYNKFYRDFGDIIKETLSKSKVISAVESARTVCLSLQQMFSSLGEEDQAEEMRDIRNLAKRLAMSFGINLQLIRKPLLTLHQDGIQFAVRRADDDDEGSNLRFLEILSEFSFKLVLQDRTQLLNYLRSVCGGVSSSSVMMYERSLRLGSRNTAPRSPNQTPAKKRRRTERSVNSLDNPILTSTVQPDRAAHTRRRTRSPSGSYSSDQLSGDDFLQRSVERKVLTHSSEHSEVQSQISALSLIEEDLEEEIVDYDDEDFEMSVSLPSTRHSTSFLEDLFE
ncbi:cohesin subunit SA-3 isoform X4 [Astyanax mexicanus]|uniref:cohesin subunit SA-3 isoform X4 n=1 Tax=Astyanax mexicanus TaxID=7994 RepID=UPI0020CAFED3|nr:cohesin subunit SA-3 isoform X4 [Astyanax mexicanus]XP_049323895.1 cohesin subunit SA-3 isoform X4 [Astyanax mexicanus]